MTKCNICEHPEGSTVDHICQTWSNERIREMEDHYRREMFGRMNAQQRVKALEKSKQEIIDSLTMRHLEWRGIDTNYPDDVCRGCGGSGNKTYGDTTTWRGGAGGQAMTVDICNVCWGSGNQKTPWIDLRKVNKFLRK